jgi:hypothetical protein
MKGVKNNNDSVSPSPLFFAKEVVVYQCTTIIILKFFSAHSLQVPPWCDSLRQADLVSTAAAIARLGERPLLASSAEVVGADDFTAEDVTVSALAASSSRTSYSSLESLRMMTLPLPDGLRTPRLRSPKSLLANSSPHRVSRMRPSSSEDEDRSTTGTFSAGLPCSNTGEQGRREEIFDGDPGGGEDPDGADDGVEPPLDNEDPSLEGEREHLVPSCLPS